jgi:outer membrane protein
MKRGVLVIIAAVCGLMLASGPARGEMKIAVVDLQKALEMSSEGKKAKAVFSKKVEKVQAELKAKQEELDTSKGELERQGSLLSEEARAEKERNYQYKLRDFQRLYKDSQEELQREDAELSERILKGLQSVIEKIGKQGDYGLILEKSHGAVLFSSITNDITEQVIKMYDESQKSAKSP